MSFTHLFPLGGKTNKPDILGSLEDSSADVQKGNLNQIDEATNMTTELRLQHKGQILIDRLLGRGISVYRKQIK